MGNSIRTTSNTQTTTNSTLAHQVLNGSHDDGLSIVKNKHHKVIDITEADDKEAILIPSIMLSDIACDLTGAITTLNDIGALLHLIYEQKITPHQAISMARLSHDAADTWANLLCSQLNIINEPLAVTRYGKEVVQ
ncbi:hypothetical protein [Psychrobacter sp. NPDC078631]|uniref:hypothetical protein n=1 Tax=Psychrobacter sp. NPDC078631 TaxID=3390666 RepID=UPI003D016A4D